LRCLGGGYRQDLNAFGEAIVLDCYLGAGLGGFGFFGGNLLATTNTKVLVLHLNNLVRLAVRTNH
jgi:hypothetical protein